MKQRFSIICFLAIPLLLAACVTVVPKSTHSAQIRVSFGDDQTLDQRMADYQHTLTEVKDWAAANQFAPADLSAGVHLRYKASKAGKNLQEVHFQSSAPEDKKWPPEAVLVYNPDAGYPWMEIDLGEGYGPAPSKRLLSAYNSLGDALKETFGARVSGHIW